MSTHRSIDKICCAALALVLLLTALFAGGEALGLQAAAKTMGYEDRLFDASRVHTLDIVMDGWDEFLDTCEDEEYTACAVVIDGEAYRNVGLRAKGNTSLSSVAAYGNDRYSFKVEFDCYEAGRSYYGLDKLSLNNIIQDNTYMKDFLAYQMMNSFGAAAPLCSFVFITVNGEDWGLYLAVEGVEDGFLQRNYGANYGELYKPDSMSFGGGRGAGRDFDMGDFEPQKMAAPQSPPEGGGPGGDGGQNFGGPGEGGGGGRGGMGSSDVKLQYIDDVPSSYSNIFDNAKTDITDADQARLIASLKALSGSDPASAVDVDQVLRYFVVHDFVRNGDSYTGSMVHNYYLYEKDGKLSMIPWDYNLAFGGFDSNSGAQSVVNSPIDSPVSGDTVEDRPMVAWIFSSEEYTELYHQYYRQWMEDFFASGEFEALIDAATALIAPYVERDPTKFCTYEEFETGAAALKTFCLLRAESVNGQLDGTIPSTTEGQSADSSALVDVSGLSLTDMGSMNAGGGFGGGRGGRPDQIPAMAEAGQGQEGAAPPTPPDGGGQQPQQNQQNQGGGFSGGGMDRTPSSGPAPEASQGSAPLLAVSAAVLLAGLFFALKFKR